MWSQHWVYAEHASAYNYSSPTSFLCHVIYEFCKSNNPSLLRQEPFCNVRFCLFVCFFITFSSFLLLFIYLFFICCLFAICHLENGQWPVSTNLPAEYGNKQIKLEESEVIGWIYHHDISKRNCRRYVWRIWDFHCPWR